MARHYNPPECPADMRFLGQSPRPVHVIWWYPKTASFQKLKCEPEGKLSTRARYSIRLRDSGPITLPLCCPTECYTSPIWTRGERAEKDSSGCRVLRGLRSGITGQKF